MIIIQLQPQQGRVNSRKGSDESTGYGMHAATGKRNNELRKMLISFKVKVYKSRECHVLK
jgi:hypothetical protein